MKVTPAALFQGFRDVAKVGNEPIVLKNSKNPDTHFSAKTRYIGKAGPFRVVRAVRDAHSAKAAIWPTPQVKISNRRSMAKFSPFFGENRVFQHNQPRVTGAANSIDGSKTREAAPASDPNDSRN